MNFMPVEENQRKEILKILETIVEDITGSDNVTLNPTMTANDVEGWDSLSHVQILYECELKWNIRLTLQELDSLNNIGDLVEVIKKSISMK